MADGILSGPIDGPWRQRATHPSVEARPGLRATHLGSRFSGTVVGLDHDGGVVLRSPNTGMERVFRLHPGAFRVEGRTVTLVRPAPARPPTPDHPQRTASGSTAPGAGTRARVARAGRILVEGVHDAELVEKVWGDDLRVEGIVVERLDGLDHLVPGSKESRIAAAAAHPHLLVTGTPMVDVWAAVRPVRLGLAAWPQVPRDRPWKAGICAALGESDPARCWKRILGSVRTYADLEPELVGAVESLIDFVTASP